MNSAPLSEQECLRSILNCYQSAKTLICLQPISMKVFIFIFSRLKIFKGLHPQTPKFHPGYHQGQGFSGHHGQIQSGGMHKFKNQQEIQSPKHGIFDSLTSKGYDKFANKQNQYGHFKTGQYGIINFTFYELKIYSR